MLVFPRWRIQITPYSSLGVITPRAAEGFRDKYGINPGKLVKQFASTVLLTSNQESNL